jgi:uncharacterized repeat protein (TIGR02543 family)
MLQSARAASRFIVAGALVTLVLNAVVLASPSGATVSFGASDVFQKTGSVDTSFATPSNTCGVLIDALGGEGGSGYNGSDSVVGYSDYGSTGGSGGSLSELVPVSGGTTLSVSVGGGGANGGQGVAGAGGYGGGGNGGANAGASSAAGGGGGGETVVSILSGATLAVAGGGGGANDDWLVTYDEATGGNGGAGVNTSGSDGGNAIYGPFGGDASPGGGGTLTGGGAGAVGVGGADGTAGSANQGGTGAVAAGEVGGGGGSGYYGGGGGGPRSGGGGGSTYAIAGSSASNVAGWTPNPTISTNGEVVLTAEECQSTTFGAPPSSPTYGGSYSPSASSTSGLTDTFTIDPSATSVCSISGGIVSFNALGTCVVDANQSGDASWVPAAQVQQSFVVAQATPTTPTISNIPSGAVVGGTLTPSVSTDGDGLTSVTTNSSSVCSISSGVVDFLKVGTCSLTAHVGEGTNYLGADGTAQTFSIGQGTPSAPTITNLPANPATGDTFTPTVSTTGDGVTSVTSGSPGVCIVNAGVVVFVQTGICSLTAHVADGTNYLGADGTAQTLTVGLAPPRTIVILFESEGSAVATLGAPDGQSITLPPAPEMPGYVFEGWFTAPSGGTPLSSPYTVSITTTLYAQWQPELASVPVPSAPSAPAIRGSSSLSGAITITVTTLPNDGGSPITGYRCLVHGQWRVVTLNARHQFTLSGLHAHRRYAFELRAVNSVGNGAVSNEIVVLIS